MSNSPSDDPWRTATLKKLNELPDSEPLVRIPATVTGPAASFFLELHNAIHCLVLLTNAAVFADNAALVSKRIIERDSNLPKGFDPLMPLGERPGPFQKRLIEIISPFDQMVVVRLVDNFTTYLTEVIRECLKAKPQVLRSKEMVSLETVLQYTTIDELHEALIERKVDELAYLGFAKLSEWIGDRLGLTEINSFPSKNFLIELLEIRNCIVHNRALTSAKLLRATGNEPCRGLIDNPIDIDIDLIYLAARATGECASMLDERLAEKFQLPRSNATRSETSA